MSSGCPPSGSLADSRASSPPDGTLAEAEAGATATATATTELGDPVQTMDGGCFGRCVAKRLGLELFLHVSFFSFALQENKPCLGRERGRRSDPWSFWRFWGSGLEHTNFLQ